MGWFDINAAVGRVAAKRIGFDTTQELRAELERLGIGEALVYHHLAAEADVLRGNQRLLEMLQGQPGLYPSWVMTPPVLGDLPEPRAWVREAAVSGVRAVRLFPRHSLYSLEEWCCGRLCAALEEAAMPLLLDYGHHHWAERVISWREIRDLCARHPRLQAVIMGVTTGEVRDAVPLLHALPGLHVEMHALSVPGIYRALTREGLLEKTLFGTGLPCRAGECAAEHLWRGLSGGERDRVASANARRLLGFPVQCAAENPASAPSAPEGIVDVHAHCGAWERTITRVRDPKTFLQEMDRCGVTQMALSSFAAIHGETPLGNRETAAFVQGGGGRIGGYLVVNPHYREETSGALREFFEETPGFVGLKFHGALHNAQLQHPGYQEALEYADAHALPVLIHGGGGEDWEGIARRYPGAAIIMAHACLWDGFDPEGRARYAPLRQVPNLYADLAGSGVHRGALRALADLAGADKVMYASDFPMFDMGFALGRVVRGPLSPEEKTAVLGGNAKRIFRRWQPLAQAD